MHSRPRPVVVLAALAVAAGTTACATQGPNAHTIELRRERGFEPSTITVHAGDDVVFANRTTRSQSLSGRANLGETEFESGRLLAYESWTVRFDQPGTYTFGGTGDDDLVAVIEVEP